MTTDVLFNFYEILVENVFGSIGLSIIGIGLVIALILMITRTTGTFLVYWLLFYGMVMFTIYFGALGLVIVFILALANIGYNIVKIWFRQD